MVEGMHALLAESALFMAGCDLPRRFRSAALDHAAGAPLIPVFIPRLGTRHYAIRIGDRFSVPHETQALERVMAEVVHAFEDAVRAFPTQWFPFVPFWPDGPADKMGMTPSMLEEAGTQSHDGAVAVSQGR